MGWEAWLTIGSVVGALVALTFNLVSADMALLCAAGIVTIAGAFSPALPGPSGFAAAFGNEALIIVAVLFVVAEGLVQTGGISLLTERLLGRPRSTTGALIRLMLP